MRLEQIYQTLKDLSEKFEIKIMEQNLRKTGIPVTSGLCKFKGKWLLIIDKHKSLNDKIGIMVSHLSRLKMNDIENMYVIPHIRELFEKEIQSQKKNAKNGSDAI